MNLAGIFKPTGTSVKKAENIAKAMVLRKVVNKSEAAKQVDQAGSIAAAMGITKKK